MEGPVSRRAALALVGTAAASLAGCAAESFETPHWSTAARPDRSTPRRHRDEPESCRQGEAFYPSLSRIDVEPYADKCYPQETFCENEADANPDKVPQIQRTVPPGVRVEHDSEFPDADDFAFYGRVTRDVAVAACRANGVRIHKTARQTLYDAPVAAPLSARLDVLRAHDVPLPPVEVKTVDSTPDVIYDRSVPGEEVRRVNGLLRPMGQLAVSLGDPSTGRWRILPVDAAGLSVSGSTLTVPLSGDPLRELFAANDVPARPGRYRLGVFVDGFHVATRDLSPAAVDGPRLADPATPVAFRSHQQAVKWFAALRHPTRSVVDIGSLCDGFTETP